MVATTFPLVLAAAALVAAPLADAHGVINKPGLAFTGSAYGGDYSATVPMSAMPATYSNGASWADIFATAFKTSKYKSLKEFILANQDMSKGRKKNPSTAECGFTAPEKQTPQALPDKIEWYGGGQNHPGPCEAWCDNEVVLPFTANCQKAYPDGKFPYDKSKCVGKSRLTFYWMATLMEWQVYIDCARIGSGTAAAGTPAAAGGAAQATNAGNTQTNGGSAARGGNASTTGNAGTTNNANNANSNNKNTNGNNNQNNNARKRSTDEEDDAAVEAARSYNFGNITTDN